MSESTTTTIDRSDVDQASATLLATIDAVARELHTGRAGLAAAGLDDSLERDIALDSLSRVELGQRLERAFDIALADNAVFDAETPRDLLRVVLKARAGRPLMIHASSDTTAAEISGVPDAARTLPEMLAWHVARHGDRTHIQFYDDYSDGASLSYAELERGATAVAGALQDRGLLPGETVALMLPTSRAYFLVFFGIVLAGAIPVPIYPPVRRQQLEDHLKRQSRILGNCRAAMLVTTAEAIGVARLLTAAVASLRHVLDADALTDGPVIAERVVRRAEDLAFVQYTSGSTGDPKGVMLTHANLLANVRADGQGMGVTSRDVFVSWLPLYHDMGLIGAWLGSLYHGVRLVVMPPLSFLARPERWLWAIHRYGGTLSAAPNFAYELCLKRIEDEALAGLDLSRWRIAANGAEAISAQTMNAFCTRFARYGFKREAMFPVYGLAECAVGLAFTPLGRGALVDVIERDALSREGRAVPAPQGAPEASVLRIVACGQPLPRHEVRIVDQASRELPERREGRLQFRGPSATAGYFNRPQETAALFVHGWLETGDRAYIAGGDIFITGRIKDIIIRAGRNIYPAELEDAIGDLDGIRKGHVAVFATADATAGTERVVVLAETRKRGDPARAKLLGEINELAADLIAAPPDDIVLAPPNTVLRTSSGKIRRAACRTLYEQGRIGQSDKAVWVQVAHLALAGVLPQSRRALDWLRSHAFALWGWCAFATLAMVAWSVAWLPLSRRRLWQLERLIARGAARVTATAIDVSGLARLPPEGEACIVVSNHQSYLDGVLMLAMLPRPPHFLVKAELAASPLLATPLRRLGALFVERFDAAAGIANMRDASAVLATGGMLVVFPEGTFKRMPGVLPFHLGAFALAADARVALVPLAIRGTRSILRAGSWFPRHGPIDVTIGAAITAPASAERWPATLQLRDAARLHLIRHAGEPDLAHESNEVD